MFFYPQWWIQSGDEENVTSFHSIWYDDKMDADERKKFMKISLLFIFFVRSWSFCWWLCNFIMEIKNNSYKLNSSSANKQFRYFLKEKMAWWWWQWVDDDKWRFKFAKILWNFICIFSPCRVKMPKLVSARQQKSRKVSHFQKKKMFCDKIMGRSMKFSRHYSSSSSKREFMIILNGCITQKSFILCIMRFSISSTCSSCTIKPPEPCFALWAFF